MTEQKGEGESRGGEEPSLRRLLQVIVGGGGESPARQQRGRQQRERGSREVSVESAREEPPGITALRRVAATTVLKEEEEVGLVYAVRVVVPGMVRWTVWLSRRHQRDPNRWVRGRAVGLTPEWWGILSELAEQGGMSEEDLLGVWLTAEGGVPLEHFSVWRGRAFAAAVRRGRAFWQSHTLGVRLGWQEEGIPLGWEWRESNNGMRGHFTLASPERERWVLVTNTLPWFAIDRHRRCVAPVILPTGVSWPMVQRLQVELPDTIGKEELQEFSRRWCTLFPHHFPPPLEVPQVVVEELPTFVLQLRRDPEGARVVQPEVTYGGVRVLGNGEVVHEWGEEQVVVVRTRQERREREWFEAVSLWLWPEQPPVVGAKAWTDRKATAAEWEERRRRLPEALARFAPQVVAEEGFWPEVLTQTSIALQVVEEQGGEELAWRGGVVVGEREVVPIEWVAAELFRRFGTGGWPEELMVPWPGRETEGCAVVTLRPLEPVLRLACELLQREPKRRGTLRVSRYEVGVVAAAAAWVQFEEGSRVASALAELRRGGPPRVPPPRGLQAVLRPYQEEGLAWLQFWRRYRWHGVLADDMGLGKTLQTIAHLLCEQEQGRLQQPALVVAPTSVVGGWVRALAQFAPSLRVIAWQGTERKGEQERLKKTDVVVTSYPLVWRDAPLLTAEEWSVVVLDEAQMVKNPRARAATAVRRLHAEQRLCLTGTPMENHLGELWAIFDWLLPGFLGSEGFFQREYRIPIEREGDEARLEFLRRRVRPFLVRRSKGEVAEDLPPKSEIVEVLTLGERQAAVYEAIRVSMQERVRQAWAERGLAKSQWTVLDALLKLRQCCCDPSLVDVPQAKRVRESVKLEWLRSRLPELVAEGRRVLLFSQFVTFLRRVEELLREQGIAYEVLTGETRDRQGVVERFERGESPVFLLSLRAGGTGLNLTAADTVVVLDPWWNPAVEEQAIDRVHRIGQERPVFVYKLICAQTVEEQVVALQRQKRALFDGALAGGEASGEKGLREEEIEALLAVTPVQRRERSAPA